MPRSKNTVSLESLTREDLAPLVGAEGPTLLSALQAILTWTTSRSLREQVMRDADFPLPDDLDAFLVVNQLVYRGVARPTDLANAIDRSRSNLSKIVGRVEQAGLVYRATDPRDDRGVVIGLTSRGRALGRRILSALGSEADLPDWSEDELRTLERLMIKMAISIDALSHHGLATTTGISFADSSDRESAKVMTAAS